MMGGRDWLLVACPWMLAHGSWQSLQQYDWSPLLQSRNQAPVTSDQYLILLLHILEFNLKGPGADVNFIQT